MLGSVEYLLLNTGKILILLSIFEKNITSDSLRNETAIIIGNMDNAISTKVNSMSKIFDEEMGVCTKI